MQDSKRSDSMFQILRALWIRRKWPAISVFILSFSAVVSLVISLPNIYRATATVLVNSGDTWAPQDSGGGSQGNQLDTVTAQVMSRARLQSLVDRFGLYHGLKDHLSQESIIDRMRHDIQLQRKETDQQQWGHDPVFAFTLSYQGWNPKLVTQVTNTLVSSYVDENNRIRASQADETVNSLKRQITTIKSKLDSQQQRIDAFKNNHIGELPEQQEVNLATLTQLNMQLHQNSENEIEAMRRRDDLLKQMTASGDASVAQLEQELSKLKTRYTDEYPDVVRIKSQIAAMKREQQAHVTDSGMSPLQHQYASLENQIASYKKDDKDLKAEIEKYQKRVGDVPIFADKLQVLTEGYAETKDVYSSLLKRYEKARLAEGADGHIVDQYRILDPAVVPRSPAGPNRIRLLLAGLILCLGLSAGGVFLMEQLDTSFHSIADLRAFTAVPVLSGIPKIITKGDVWRGRLKVSTIFSTITVTAVIIVLGVRIMGHGNEELALLLTRFH